MVEIQDVDDEIALCCSEVDSKVSVLQTSVDACCFTLNSKLDVLLDASCVAISAPTTITAPGTYCLVINITGASPAIVIDSNDVVLDLNGKTVDNAGLSDVVGIRVAAGRHGIVIKNGFLDKSGTQLGTAIDLVPTCAGVILENLSINNWNTGISGTSVTGVVIKNCGVNACADDGLALNLSSNITVEQSDFNSNGSSGIELAGCTKVAVQGCSMHGNTVNGLFMQDGSNGVTVTNCLFNGNTADGVLVQNSGCVEFVHCSATGNTDIPSGDGYHIQSTNAPVSVAANILCKECSACGYTNGFHGEDVNNLCIFDCVAKDNATNGFFVEGSASIALLRNNTATGNTERGFRDNGDVGESNQYYNNVACENGLQNYSNAIVSAPVTSAVNARGGANIDCDNSALDTVDLTYSKVCAIESQLDLCCDVNVSSIELVASSLDACCFTLNSKVDAVKVRLMDAARQLTVRQMTLQAN